MLLVRKDRPLRVLHLLDHSLPNYSGYSFRSRYVLRNLKTQGVDVAVVTSARQQGEGPSVDVIDGIEHHRTRRPADFLSRAQLRVPFWRERIMTGAMVERLSQVARTFRPQLIHAHSPFFNGQAAVRVGAELGLPVVYEIRAFWEDDAVDKNKISEDGIVYRQVRRLETEVVKQASGVICICEGLRRDLMERGIASDKIVVAKNGVDVETFVPRPRREALARKLGVAGKRVVGFIGSFFFYEGLCDLVRAAATLANQIDDFAVVLVGSGEDEPNVRALVAELGVQDRVILTGRVAHEDIADYYALIDVFCYPRRSKRLTEKVTPLKPLEAMAMERTCIGSDVGGIRELFDECGVGRVFRAGDAADLARLLAESIGRASADLAEEGHRGRSAVLSQRCWGETVMPTVELYRRLIGGDPQPRADGHSSVSELASPQRAG